MRRALHGIHRMPNAQAYGSLLGVSAVCLLFATEDESWQQSSLALSVFCKTANECLTRLLLMFLTRLLEAPTRGSSRLRLSQQQHDTSSSIEDITIGRVGLYVLRHNDTMIPGPFCTSSFNPQGCTLPMDLQAEWFRGFGQGKFINSRPLHADGSTVSCTTWRSMG